MSARYLTKSRFKLAVECPTKLFYTGKNEYRDALKEDDFLAALAEGGYQVGALAQLTYPEGIEIKELQVEKAVAETAKYLQQKNVVLFEPAIQVGKFLIRIDILIKEDDHFELIEVKAKSFNSLDPEIESKRGGISSSMRPYIQDAAFQTWVLRQAFPQALISTSLMMPDKAKVATLSGVNQMFKIESLGGRMRVIPELPAELDGKALSKGLLTKVCVDKYVSEVIKQPLVFPGGEAFLSDVIMDWSSSYALDEKIPPKIGAQCGTCQFVSKDGDDRKSGFLECWSQSTGLSSTKLLAGTVLDLWNFRGKQRLIDKKQFLLTEVGIDDLGDFDPDDIQSGLSRAQRQWMQVSSALGQNKHPGFYFDSAYVSKEMANWQYPLHFIDFETSSVALPFHRGMRPYEPVAFQFSHHQMDSDGSVHHVGQFLDADPGQFPNYDFARALKTELDKDLGTVFMWSHHENTILTKIIAQLQESENPPDDRDELITFLGSLIKGGDRQMVDLCLISEKAFFHPDTKGSNSIKKVLPAILKISNWLQETYSKPTYGQTGVGIRSLNYGREEGFVWLEEGQPDPYSKLKSIAKNLLPEGASVDSVIAEGGAAATAYARLQFEKLKPDERVRIQESLLRYCELDTLAMVMVVQAWQEFCS